MNLRTNLLAMFLVWAVIGLYTCPVTSAATPAVGEHACASVGEGLCAADNESLNAVSNDVCFGERSSSVLLQGFHWESKNHDWWLILEENAEFLRQAGIDGVWLPPSSAAASKDGYLPTELYVQDSWYGTEDELKRAIKALNRHGVIAIADIVINHRCGTTDWADFTNPDWGLEAVCSDDGWPFGQGAPDTGWSYHAARDIDHTNINIRRSIRDWMLWLKEEIGYAGWRYDLAGGFAGEFFYWYNNETNPAISVGEYWTNLDINNPDAHRQELCDWIDSTYGYTSAFDFTTKGMLQEAVSRSEYWRMRDSNGRATGLIGWWPAKAVTFVDNHDTGPSPGGEGGQNYWPFPSDRVMEGYAYILTHPGIPCIYWPHLMDWGDVGNQIVSLIQLRKNMGIHATSELNIVEADHQKYAAIIDGRTAVKIGHGHWEPGAGWNLATYGNNYAVWVREGRSKAGTK